MRLAFFGSGDFAAPCLYALARTDHDLVRVVTQPDRPAGRGGRVRMTPVKEAALALDLPVDQPETLRGDEPVERLRAARPDLAVIVAYGKKVPPAMLAAPPHGFINAHASILPKYRGAAPVPHAILEGESETGVTVFQLEEDWDSGPVYAEARTPIRGRDTAGSVLDRLAPLAADLLVQVVDAIADGSVRPQPQPHGEATRAPKFSREDGLIDWTAPADRIDRQVRAFQPWPEAFSTLPGKRGQTLRLHILGVEREPDRDPDAAAAAPGEAIVADGKAGLVVATGTGEALRLTAVKPAGKRPMTGAEFVRGHRVEPGARLGA